jgi:hypothetical protein
MTRFEDDDVVARGKIKDIAWQVRWGIRIAGVLLIGLFAWLQLKPAELANWLQNTPPDSLLKIGLAAFYACWHFGSLTDLYFQESVLERDPARGAIPLTTYAVFVGFVLAAIVLVWSSASEQLFSATLCAFWTVSFAAGVYMRRFLNPKIKETMTYNYGQSDFYKLEKLVIVTRYFFATWNRARSVVGFLLTLILVAVTWSAWVRQNLAVILAGAAKVPTQIVLALIPSLVFWIFLIVTEGWQWLMRVQTHNALSTLDKLRERYRLELRFPVRR